MYFNRTTFGWSHGILGGYDDADVCAACAIG